MIELYLQTLVEAYELKDQVTKQKISEEEVPLLQQLRDIVSFRDIPQNARNEIASHATITRYSKGEFVIKGPPAAEYDDPADPDMVGQIQDVHLLISGRLTTSKFLPEEEHLKQIEKQNTDILSFRENFKEINPMECFGGLDACNWDTTKPVVPRSRHV